MQGEMMVLVSRYGLSPADRLIKKLTEEEVATLDEAARLAGLSAGQLDVFRPWFAALTISTAAMTHAGFDPASGVDSKIESIFRARNIIPKGFETAEEQIKVFAGMTPEQELQYLRETMEEYHDAPTGDRQDRCLIGKLEGETRFDHRWSVEAHRDVVQARLKHPVGGRRIRRRGAIPADRAG